MFVVGRGNVTLKLLSEKSKYRDIFLVESPDGYDDLSYKVKRSFFQPLEKRKGKGKEGKGKGKEREE